MSDLHFGTMFELTEGLYNYVLGHGLQKLKKQKFSKRASPSALSIDMKELFLQPCWKCDF